MSSISIGAMGEVLAARFLRDKKYTIISSNYRCRQGEIDIIAQDGPYIVFVEVKTRSENALYPAREAVTAAKQRRLIIAARVYLSRYETKLQPRFDVVEVITEPGAPVKVSEINHIIGAFEAGDLSGAF